MIAFPVVLAGFVTAIGMAGLLALDVYRDLGRDLLVTQVRTKKVLEDIDGVLRTVAPKVAGNECTAVLETLRRYAAFDHLVRSLAMIRDGRVYCPSLFPDDEYLLDDVADVDSPIRLLAGSPRWPRSPALTVRYEGGGAHLLAFVSDRTLKSLVPASGPGVSWLHVGHAKLVLDGAAESAQHSPIWMRRSEPVRPGVWIERVVTRQQVLERIGEAGLFMFALAVLAAGFVGLLYWRACHRAGVLPNQLRAALGRGQFIPYYQPIVSVSPGFPVLGFEILMRWRKPREGVIAPADFLPVAERAGLLLDMTDALMSRVVVDVNALPVFCGKALGLNLAAGHLRDARRLIALTERFQRGTQGSGARLTLEISERSLKVDLVAGQATLEVLKAMGVRLSVDDFGTGNANLDTLCEMRFDNVKCDRFIAGLVHCGDRREVIPASMVELIHHLGLSVVVEGIETPEQVEFFSACGVEFLQGYYFGRPMPGEDLAAWLLVHQARFAQAGSRWEPGAWAAG